ncbi:uncharacterized protein LOC131876468 [Cryptomeria japonica]|uniref:uncharacterized protein LOC131876468 n=1 Tax=Cryptomeria japonica TaxID=3369 RepID=UPI0027DAA0D4|nr:uncharacterized protein LOC131876468 [Cryptomeria japonica]
MEEGRPSKEESIQSKKRKSATGMKTQDDKNDIEENRKDDSEMETNDSGGEESWKDEDVGAEEDEAKDVCDQDSPIHSASLGNDNSQPMVDKDDKDNEEKDMNSERVKNKEPEKETAKDSLSKYKECNLEKHGKQMDEKRKEDDRNQKHWKQDMEEKAKKMAT